MTYLPVRTASRGGVVLEPRTGPAGLGPGLLPPKRCWPSDALMVGGWRVLSPHAPHLALSAAAGGKLRPPPHPPCRGQGRTRIRLSDSTLLSPVEKNSLEESASPAVTSREGLQVHSLLGPNPLLKVKG